MKVVSVVGARPQFVKAGIVSRKLRENGVREILVHTGQHYDFNMSDVFFKELKIPQPDYYLGIGSAEHGEQTGKMLIEIEKVLIKEKPDIVIVYGDTNSTLAGALAATKIHIPVAHVEAGLRSYNKKMPEEINRVLTDHISTYLFCPTQTAVDNLKKEGIKDGIYNVGDVMYDVALEVIDKIDEKSVLEKFMLKPKEFVLVTIHRAENTDNIKNFMEIWEALNKIASDGIKLFFPVHPRTKKVIQNLNLTPSSNNLILNEPISYFEMVALEKNASVIITDSGGVQKEGYFFGTPCVVVREETEWVELVEIGFNILTDKEKIVYVIKDFLSSNVFGNKHDFKKNIFGNGDSADIIVKVLLGE